MKISGFIRDNIEAILQEWEQFAREVQPKTGEMSVSALRDHAKLMLDEIVEDIDLPESKLQQKEKSQGRKPQSSSATAAIDHGLERLSHGFHITVLMSEYRYLRASILRLWEAQRPEEVLDVYELIRFNEAVDQLIQESVDSYSTEKERQARQLLTILTSSPDYAYILDSQGKFASANKSMLESFNLSLEQLRGKTLSELNIHPAAKLEDDFQMVLQTAESRIGEVSYTLPSGDERQYEYVLSPVVDGASNVEAVAALERDVTERNTITAALRKSEERLLILNQELEQRVDRRTFELLESQKQILHADKLASIGKLSASIAHEFNNPLQGILSVITGVEKRATMEEEDRKLLIFAIEECYRIADLINSLQDFNRPTTGKTTLINVHHVLDSILIMQKSKLNGRKILVERNYTDGLPQIIAVLDQIKQVFLNLLVNAEEACPQFGGVIRINTRQEREKVVVAIQDNGIGIKLEEMEHIFRPFYTTKSEVKGTGLGLSVCFGIIKKHHGEIRVESQPGKGATFSLLLPINGGKGTPAVADM